MSVFSAHQQVDWGKGDVYCRAQETWTFCSQRAGTAANDAVSLPSAPAKAAQLRLGKRGNLGNCLKK